LILKTKLLGHVYQFQSVKDVLAKANEVKSGDSLAGIAAESAEERVAAKVVVANLTLADLRNHPAVPYEEDEVTRIIQDDVNETIYDEIKNWTVAELREWLLDERNDSAAIRRRSSLRPGRWAGSAAAPAVPAPDPGAGRSTGLQRPAAAVRTAALSQAGAAGEGGTGSPAGAPVPPGPEISGWMGGVRHV